MMTNPVASSRPSRFGPAGILLIVLVIATGNLVGTVLVLLWASMSGTPWRSLGLRRPERLWLTIILGVVGGIALKFFTKALVMPLLGADAVNPTYHYLAGNVAALPGLLATVIIGGGFGEELIWRGFLFERSASLFGTSRTVKLATVVVTAILFALAHLHDQGVQGAEQAVVTGLVFGSVFAITGQLVPVMIAHAAYDVIALLMIYWNMEPAVAHLFFR